MPPDRGRANKACAACRKQKTRCFDVNGSASTCLRCDRLGLRCSFVQPDEQSRARQHDGGRISEWSANFGRVDDSETASRLRRLEDTVSHLVEKLDDGLLPGTGRSGGLRRRRNSLSRSPERSRASSRTDLVGEQQQPPSAPMQVIQDIAAEVETGSSAISRPGASVSGRDLMQQGVLSYREASVLLGIFQEHYGRWVGFDHDTPVEELLELVKMSDGLLSACCLIAVRHTTQDLAERLAQPLFGISKSWLSEALLTTPQPLEFFQTALVLSMWSTSVNQTPMGFDSWLVSGMAIQHCLASDVFHGVLVTGKSHARQGTKLLARWAVWNHLCLVHLHYCVGTRRRAMIGPVHIKRCRKILDFDGVTNYETRMLAEIFLYWTVHESLSNTQIDVSEAQWQLSAWIKEWRFLFDQPRSQFLEMGYAFAELLAYEIALKTKTARVKETLLTEMVTLSVRIINLAMDTTDDRTRHLSDHIYHMITFAAVTLCRLLNLYEAQLSESKNIAELDALVVNLVSWLHSIGLDCHIGYTLGGVIRSFHKKLRPQAELLTPSDWSTPWPASDLAPFFPELIGEVNDDGMNWNFVPDWEPYYAGPTI